MNTVIVLFQVSPQPVSQECTQLLFYSRHLHRQCSRNEHSDCSIPGIFTASVAGVYTVTVLFQVSSQPVSQEWTQWLFYSGHLHSQCPRSEHSHCSIPGIFTDSVPGMNTVIVLFQVSSQPVSQECTQWLFYSRYLHSQCPRNEHGDCSIPGIFTVSVPGVYTVIVLFQVSSQSVCQEWTQWLFYSGYFYSQCSRKCTQWLFYSRYFYSQCLRSVHSDWHLHSQYPRSVHSDCSIPGIFTASVPGMNTVIVLFQVSSQPVSQEWTQWLFYSRYFHSQCPRSEHSDCSILGVFTASVPGVYTVIVLFQVFSQPVSPGVNTVIVLFQVFSQPVSQEWTQWLFYSRYFHSQCPRSEHSDCALPGIFTASVPGVNTVTVLFQVFSQPVSQEWTQWLFYSRYLHSQCPRNEHSDCSFPGIFTVSVPEVNTVTVPFQVSSQSVSQEWTQSLLYSRYFHNQCPMSKHSDCSIPGIFIISIPGMYTVTVPYPGIFTASVPGMYTVTVLFQVFSQPVSQE